MPLSVRQHFLVDVQRGIPSGPPERSSNGGGGPGGYGRGGGGKHPRDKIDTTRASTYGCVSLRDNASRSAKNYICVEKKEVFHISIGVEDRQDDQTYGAVLFLDGQRVHGKKTFTRRSIFPGFKMGGGKFSEFSFEVPDLAMDDPDAREKNERDGHNQNQAPPYMGNSRNPEEQRLDQKHQGRKSTIIVEFYKTEQFERKSFPNQVHKKTYEQHFMEDRSKKSFQDALRIKSGKEFAFGGPGGAGGGSSGQGGGFGGGGGRDHHSFNGGRDNNNGFNRENNNNGFNRDNNNKFGGGGDRNFERRRDQKYDDKRNNQLNRHTGNRNYGGEQGGNRGNFGGDQGGNRGNFGGDQGGNRGNFGDHQKRYGGPRERDTRDPRANAAGGGDLDECRVQIDHKILYEEMVDSCEVNYASFAALQLQRLVDIKKYEHVRLIPQSLMNSADFVTKVLWTVINHKGRLHFSKANEEFYKATGFKISDFFEFKDDEMKSFLMLKKGMFKLDQGDYAQALEYSEEEQFNKNFSGGSSQRRNGDSVSNALESGANAHCEVIQLD